MATITVRGLDDALVARLKLRARQHGRSMESEVREMLHAHVQEDEPQFGQMLVDFFVDSGAPSVELELPRRSLPRPVPGWDSIDTTDVPVEAR